MGEKNVERHEENRLSEENEYLKMKLMLENGAVFGGGISEKLPPAIENQFLRNVIAFEKQWENPVYIKIFEKIGRPNQFKPSAEIPDGEINDMWEKLSTLLLENGISLDACSPNVSNRELYRFATEELFEKEINDLRVPGMMVGFIYDEYYPDHHYDNTRIAVEDCMRQILGSGKFEWIYHFQRTGLSLNNRHDLTLEEFRMRVNNYKKAYHEIRNLELTESECVVEEKHSYVKGRYALDAVLDGNALSLSGNWRVEFRKGEIHGYWYVSGVWVEGVAQLEE